MIVFRYLESLLLRWFCPRKMLLYKVGKVSWIWAQCVFVGENCNKSVRILVVVVVGLFLQPSVVNTVSFETDHLGVSFKYTYNFALVVSGILQWLIFVAAKSLKGSWELVLSNFFRWSNFKSIKSIKPSDLEVLFGIIGTSFFWLLSKLSSSQLNVFCISNNLVAFKISVLHFALVTEIALNSLLLISRCVLAWLLWTFCFLTCRCLVEVMSHLLARVLVFLLSLMQECNDILSWSMFLLLMFMSNGCMLIGSLTIRRVCVNWQFMIFLHGCKWPDGEISRKKNN